MDRLAGIHLTQTYNHIDILEGKLCTCVPRQRQTDQILSPCLPACHKADSGGRTGVWWHVAADGSLPPPHLAPLFLSFFCHLWRRTRTLRNRPPSSKSRMQVIYHERHRSPQIKVCCASARFLSSSHAHSAHHSRTCQTEWVWKSQWHRWEFVFVSKLCVRSILNISTDDAKLKFNFFFSFRHMKRGLWFAEALYRYEYTLHAKSSWIRRSVIEQKKICADLGCWGRCWHGQNENFFIKRWCIVFSLSVLLLRVLLFVPKPRIGFTSLQLTWRCDRPWEVRIHSVLILSPSPIGFDRPPTHASKPPQHNQ